MKKRLLYIFILFPILSFGQTVQVELDTNSILLGEQTNLRISFSYRVDTGEEMKLQFPIIGDTLIKEIEVLKKSKIDTSIVDKEDPYLFTQTQNLTISSFDVGQYRLPSLTFILNDSSIHSQVLTFEVRDVASLAARDNQLVLLDIKKPLEDPLSMWDWILMHWIWFLTPLAVIIALVLIVYFLLTYKSKKVTKVSQPIISAHQIALAKLEAIQSAQLWQEGKFKQYHSEISEVIREYLEKRYAIHALEQTSDEIFTALRFKTVSQVNKENLQQLLVLADLVKFAKEIPIGSENEESMKNAILFVNETRIIEEPTSEPTK
jgi:hypothetical protein